MNLDEDSELGKRIGRIEEDLKAREFSTLCAMRTLVEDFIAYQKGDREKFPQAALLGAAVAYLRPRVVMTLAYLLAGIMAILQVWFLLSQNRLIEQQNVLIESQSRANRLQAIQSVLTGVQWDGSAEPGEQTLASLALLVAYGSEGIDDLLELANVRGGVGTIARIALAETVSSQSPGQRIAALNRFLLASLQELQGIQAYPDENFAKTQTELGRFRSYLETSADVPIEDPTPEFLLNLGLFYSRLLDLEQLDPRLSLSLGSMVDAEISTLCDRLARATTARGSSLLAQLRAERGDPVLLIRSRCASPP